MGIIPEGLKKMADIACGTGVLVFNEHCHEITLAPRRVVFKATRANEFSVERWTGADKPPISGAADLGSSEPNDER